MDKFLIGAGIGVAAFFAWQKLNQSCWTTGGSLLNSGSPICAATNSVLPLVGVAIGAGFLIGGVPGALGAAVGEGAIMLYGLSKVAI